MVYRLFAAQDAGEAAMTYPDEATLDTVVADEAVLVAEGRNDAVAAAGVASACARPPARSNGQRPRADYSEEAIPERDPAYRLADAAPCETLTAEHLTAAERRDLARCLEQLGMSRGRATILAWL
jgi:hypothetical protein